MKTWLHVVVFGISLFLSPVIVSAADFSMPEYAPDWFIAAGLYNSGVRQTQVDADKAIQTLLDAEKHVQLAVQKGADSRISGLSKAIAKALINAQERAKQNANQPQAASSSPDPAPTTVNQPVYRNNFIRANPISHMRHTISPKQSM